MAGERDESAKDTRLEESWTFPSGWGTRIGARSTGAEFCRTGGIRVRVETEEFCVGVEIGGVRVGEDTDLR